MNRAGRQFLCSSVRWFWKVFRSISVILVILVLGMMVFVWFSKTEYKVNDDISEAKRAAIKQVTEQLFRSVHAHDTDGVRALLSQPFKKSGVDVENSLMSILNATTIGHPSIIDEIDINVVRAGSAPHKYYAGGENAEYFLEVVYRESRYLVLATSRVEQTEYLFVMSYVQENREWKLQSFDVAIFSLGGMNANELYEKAKAEFAAERYLTAYIYAQTACAIVKPLVYFNYSNEDQIKSFYEKTQDKAKTFFPLSFEDDVFSYSVYSLTTGIRNDSFSPLFDYYMDIPSTTVNPEKADESSYTVVTQMSSLFPELNEFEAIYARRFSQQGVFEGTAVLINE